MLSNVKSRRSENVVKCGHLHRAGVLQSEMLANVTVSTGLGGRKGPFFQGFLSELASSIYVRSREKYA